MVYVADYKGLRKLKADGTRVWAFDCWGHKSNVVLDGGMVSFFCSKTLYLLGEDGSTLLKRRFKPLASNLVKKDTLFVFATVDKKVFDKLMNEQRNRAKASWKGSGDAASTGDFKSLLEWIINHLIFSDAFYFAIDESTCKFCEYQAPCKNFKYLL